MRAWTVVLAVIALLFSQCGRALPDEFLRTLERAAYVEAGLVYGTGGGRELKLDLYRPSAKEGPFPAVVFVHGGGWRAGHRGHFSRQAMYLATRGYVCACIEYRLSGEARFPAAIEDVKCALRWMRAVGAREFQVDPERIAVSGGSAGGHLALLAGTSGGVGELEGEGGWGEQSSRVQLVVAFNPACEFVGFEIDAVKDFLGGSAGEVPEAYRMATPSSWLDGSDPPMLVLHGREDSTVPYAQAERFVAAAKAAGVAAELYTEEGVGHSWFSFPPHFAPTTQALASFLDRHFW